MKPYYNVVLLLSSLLLPSCGGADLLVDEPLLASYHAQASIEKHQRSSDKIDCYFDYSEGMGPKVASALTTFKNLANVLGGKEELSYFKVGTAAQPVELDITSPASNFKIAGNYNDHFSRLRPALEAILDHPDRTSIFITDFEQTGYNNEVSSDAWAQTYFKEWLVNGNQLDIFAIKVSGSTPENWINALIFSPGNIISDEALYKKSVLKSLLENLSGEIRHFTYTASDFELSSTSTDDTQGNANDDLVIQDHFPSAATRDFDYYEVTTDDLMTFLSDEALEDKRIVSKLIAKPKKTTFSEFRFGLKTYDITASLTDLHEKQEQEPPEIKEDIETGKRSTAPRKSTALKPGKPADGVFDLVYNQQTGALGIKLNPNFTGIEATTVYRVDIVPEALRPKNFSAENEVLRINRKKCDPIRPLEESLEFAIKELATDLEGRPIYTLYIKITK